MLSNRSTPASTSRQLKRTHQQITIYLYLNCLRMRLRHKHNLTSSTNRFDKNWLVPKYRNFTNVKNDKDLNDRERKVLKGVHDRDYRTGGRQAENPSVLDYETLNNAYKMSLPNAKGL